MYHPVYMAVDEDDVPYAIADSAWELARMLGITVYPILHATCSNEKNPIKNSKYKRVWVSDSDDE